MIPRPILSDLAWAVAVVARWIARHVDRLLACPGRGVW